MPTFEGVSKPELRRLFRTRRLQVLTTETALQQRIRDQLKLELRRRHQRGELSALIGLYWPLPGEVDLRPLRGDLLAEFGLRTALPIADGKGQMTYGCWTEAPLVKDACGILAPARQSVLKAEELSLLLVPALAVDRMGLRLGYGGGYYDRLRSRAGWCDVPALLVLPGACVSQKPLPNDPWDRPFEGWVCENGFHCSGC